VARNGKASGAAVGIVRPADRLTSRLMVASDDGPQRSMGWAKDEPDGTVKLEVRDVGAGLVGWTWGHGVLNYKGKSHPFEGVKITLEH
jgi:hypothetical protein